MKFIRLAGLVVAALVVTTGCAAPSESGAPTEGTSTPAPQSSAPQSPAAKTPADSQSPAASPSPDEPAPEKPVVAKELKFTTKTVDGKDFDGASLAGKPAVLWFWAPWCPICQREAPTIGKVAKANPDVTFVGVAAQDEVPAMKDFVSKYELDSFDHLADLDASIWTRFTVTYQPAFAFIGADGSVEVHKGTLSEADLTERLTALPST